MACLEYNGAIYCDGGSLNNQMIFSHVEAILDLEENKQKIQESIDVNKAQRDVVDFLSKNPCLSEKLKELFEKIKKSLGDEDERKRFAIEVADFYINKNKCDANQYGANFSCDPNLKFPKTPSEEEVEKLAQEASTNKSSTKGNAGKNGKNTPAGKDGKDGASKKNEPKKCKK